MCKEMEKLKNESYAEGREEGRAEQAKRIARNMQAQNFSLEQIARTVEYDEKTVEKWIMSGEE